MKSFLKDHSYLKVTFLLEEGGSGGFSWILGFLKREHTEKYRQSLTISPLRFENPTDSSAKCNVCEPKFTVLHRIYYFLSESNNQFRQLWILDFHERVLLLVYENWATKYLVKTQLHKNKNAPFEAISHHCAWLSIFMGQCTIDLTRFPYGVIMSSPFVFFTPRTKTGRTEGSFLWCSSSFVPIYTRYLCNCIAKVRM